MELLPRDVKMSAGKVQFPGVQALVLQEENAVAAGRRVAAASPGRRGGEPPREHLCKPQNWQTNSSAAPGCFNQQKVFKALGGRCWSSSSPEPGCFEEATRAQAAVGDPGAEQHPWAEARGVPTPRAGGFLGASHCSLPHCPMGNPTGSVTAGRPVAVQHLTVHNVSAQSMLLAWQPVSGATGYRLSWATLTGRCCPLCPLCWWPQGRGRRGQWHPKGWLCWLPQGRTGTGWTWMRGGRRMHWGGCSPTLTTWWPWPRSSGSWRDPQPPCGRGRVGAGHGASTPFLPCCHCHGMRENHPIALHQSDAPVVCGAGGSVARGSLAHGVPLAEAGAEQMLRTNILGPTSIQVLWTSAHDARGYRLEWKRATGRLRVPHYPHGPPVPAACTDPRSSQDRSPPGRCRSPAAPTPTS